MKIFTDNVKGLFDIERDNHIDISNYNSDREVISNYGDILKNKGKENFGFWCFNYALDNGKLEFMEDAVDILFEEYIEIKKLKDMQKGDIILFYDDFETLHLAKIVKTDGTIQGTKVRAKFGQLGIYEHWLKDTPIGYGDRFIIFRENKNVKRYK